VMAGSHRSANQSGSDEAGTARDQKTFLVHPLAAAGDVEDAQASTGAVRSVVCNHE
jgi:hypothetical protein